MLKTLVLLLVLACSVKSAVAEPSESVATNVPVRRLVFAHYMVCFGNSVPFCKEEIRLAQQHGLDGFALDFGAWGVYDSKTRQFSGTGGYIANAENMFQAAKELGTGFKLLLTPEYSVQPIEAAVDDMVKRFYNHPNVMRHQGKMVLSSYGPGGAAYGNVIEKLKAEGYDLFFVPFTGNNRHSMARSVESVYQTFLDQKQVDGMWLFETDDSVEGSIRDNANARRGTLMLDKLYMAGVSPSYASANIRDMQGIAGYGAVWEGIVNDRPEWVEIVTWNDYNEDSYLMPYKWKMEWYKPIYNKDGSHLDATAYYAGWYKTGQAPKITQDKLFFCYRNRSRELSKAWDEKQQAWVDVRHMPNFDQIHDDLQDLVYVSTFLTAPAELTVTLGSTKQTFSLPAGVSHHQLPMTPGVPRFELRRGRNDLLDVVGRRSILSDVTKENSPNLGFRLLNRTWPGAAAVGKAMRVEAESGTLHGSAFVVEQDRRTCVQTMQTNSSGFDLSVKGLSSTMYNIRVVYCNPSAEDVRLTLMADGAPRLEGDDKASVYYIPVFLPPTGKGQFATATFFWPLYDKTTRLTLEWRRGSDGDPAKDNNLKPEWDDKGAALIDALELVRVEPTVPTPPRESIFPEMVSIPAGSFAMGSKNGEPDEQPVHKVKVAAFAMALHEVTNDEFERFAPQHREVRDGFSWRDREPVIYVSWNEAAQYCNWLSAQAGLTPAYEEKESGEPGKTRKDWVINLKADGYRLPTEAEWEYAASGRGENRPYPWGDAAPVSLQHGLFAPADILQPDARRRSQPGEGVMVVGCFPAGASRDGVMDLAGNVAEWCSDWYSPYSEQAADNPCQQVESHSRVIRGGSWGYYSRSQRCADREFNSPKYPGYIFIGFRVVLPAAGWKKMEAK